MSQETARSRRGAATWPAWRASRVVQCSGTSPKTSLIRLRSLIRGWVAPPTQRLTVFTDTPSWRAAASWVIPSRRSALDIHSANELECFSAADWPSTGWDFLAAEVSAGTGVVGGPVPDGAVG